MHHGWETNSDRFWASLISKLWTTQKHNRVENVEKGNASGFKPWVIERKISFFAHVDFCAYEFFYSVNFTAAQTTSCNSKQHPQRWKKKQCNGVNFISDVVCIQPSAKLQSLRSRPVQGALHAAKSTVNVWGVGSQTSGQRLKGRAHAELWCCPPIMSGWSW